MASTPSLSQSDVTTYPALFRRVKETLLDGQRRIESEKVRTYWQTGQLIQTHILKNKSRADYGGDVIARLARDLDVAETVIKDCRRFAQRYPRLPIRRTCAEFTWSHYRQLMLIADKTERSRFEETAGRRGWSVQELSARIRTAHPRAEEVEEAASECVVRVSSSPLVPLRGALYTYKILKPKFLSGGSELVVDLGFEITRDVENELLAGLTDGTVVESISKGRGYAFNKGARTAKDLYTYQAFVERVVDGDTLKVRVDLGFGVWIRETLRLRGIDCPELKTKEGDAAKAFVQSLVKEADRLVIRSSRSDKYGRYVADVFITTAKGGEDIFLNGLLLEKNFAERYE